MAGLLDKLKLTFTSAMYRATRARRPAGGDMGSAKAAAPGKIYSIEARGIDGKPRSLGDYRGKVLLVVNVASKCGFTPQYGGLEALHKRYGPRGLEVLGFPCNDFGAQEPGAEGEIQKFCRMSYGVSFDLFSKISVLGAAMHPLYALLTRESGFDGDIPWNFAKFLVDRQGGVAARFEPDDDPLSSKVTEKIEQLLG